MKQMFSDIFRALKVLLLMAAAVALFAGDRVLGLFLPKPAMPDWIVDLMLAGGLVIAALVAEAIASDLALVEELTDEEAAEETEKTISK